ncbi:hypothetical protein BU204_24355 [Actinophytocola xanthii]|uniref:Protein kinase domain-containing protein n=1 Tax=Actinophytocola xanthii TaxID=1912961 RepID=A0A1Q8CKI3_9PSEU|nr:hypothetical protein BU204_24355 [Actinophytocola xanthii]
MPGGAAVDGVELIRDTLFRYDLMDSTTKPVTLQTYWDVSELGGRLWDQEVRILLRAASTRHPALPAVVKGGFVEGVGGRPGFAFVLTEGFNERLVDASNVIPFMHEHPAEAVHQLSLLADALSVLHGMGVVHRNLWPGTIDVDTSQAGELPRLRLSRFEMSRLVSDLLRSPTIDADRGAQARQLFLDQGARAARYVPPERLAFLYPDEEGAPIEDERSDVFSLGMLVSEWFLGSLPELPDDVDRPNERRAWLTQMQEERRQRIRIDTTLPSHLTELLHEMTEPACRHRPRAAEVVSRISKHYEAMTELWSTSVELPYLVAFQPSEFLDTALRWGWISADPTTSEGREQLADFIERDLRRAKLVHSEDGAESAIRYSGDSKSKSEARQVLLGERVLWYCRPWREQSAYGGQGAAVDEVLLIRYVVGLESERGRTSMRALRRGGRERPVPAVEAVPTDMARAEFTARRKGRPAWSSLIQAVGSSTVVSGEVRHQEQAFDWLVEFQWVELRARQYAYELLDVDGERAVVRFDQDRDSARGYRSALATLYAESESRRPLFADFFAGLTEDDEDEQGIDVRGDDNGEPSRPEGLRAYYHDRKSGDAITVRVPGGANRLPAQGWLCPASDRGSQRVLMRQEAARQELLDNRVLASQLRKPLTIEGRREPWAKAPGDLMGDGRAAVVDMLAIQPFFALQGPPGTGKTTVAAHAIAAYLRRETGRVLVSAQSNFALDNLARSVLRETNAVDGNGRPRDNSEVIALRVSSAAGADRVDTALRPFGLVELTGRRADALRRHADAELVGRRDPRAREVLGHWRRVVDSCEPELADRLRRGANVVFATCAAATPEAVARAGSSATYDWVVIEEAAKAWPTELAIPLVRGLRWTLIGDHHQLPAHRRREVEDFLTESARHDNTELALDDQVLDSYKKFFDLFGALFDDTVDHNDTSAHRATRTLSTQFRMREPICEVVSRVFYPADENEDQPLGPGLLTTGRAETPAWPTAPDWLHDHALVWLDTSELQKEGDEPYWQNQTEAELVKSLVSKLRPRPSSLPSASDRQPLAVLTPYRQQARLLTEDRDVEPYVSTLHAFQGRQADVVIVSMVRDTVRGDADKPWLSIGHLTQAQLVNVMLSRARDLLVIVGDLPHLVNSGSPTWRRLGLAFEEFGVVIPASRMSAG